MFDWVLFCVVICCNSSNLICVSSFEVSRSKERVPRLLERVLKWVKIFVLILLLSTLISWMEIWLKSAVALSLFSGFWASGGECIVGSWTGSGVQVVWIVPVCMFKEMIVRFGVPAIGRTDLVGVHRGARQSASWEHKQMFEMLVSCEGLPYCLQRFSWKKKGYEVMHFILYMLIAWCLALNWLFVWLNCSDQDVR